MKKYFYLFIFALLCSCTTKQSTGNVDNLEVEEDSTMNYDLGLVCVKGPVKTLTYGCEGYQHTFIFNKEAKIIAWYKRYEPSILEIEKHFTFPVVFERDSLESICLGKFKIPDDRTLDIGEFTKTFSYNSLGLLTGADGNEYCNYDENGWPTYIREDLVEDYDTISVEYSDFDEYGNWCKSVHNCKLNPDCVYKRDITYYNGTEDETFAANEEKKYLEAIDNFSDTLAVVIEYIQKEKEYFYQAQQNGLPDWVYGTWELQKDGNLKVVITNGNIEEYKDGEQTYSGSYGFMFTGHINHGKTFYYLDYANERLMAEKNGSPMRKTASSYSSSQNYSDDDYNSSADSDYDSQDSNPYAKYMKDLTEHTMEYRSGSWRGDPMTFMFLQQAIIQDYDNLIRLARSLGDDSRRIGFTRAKEAQIAQFRSQGY